MTELELDRLMRRVLLDGIKADAEQEQSEPAGFEASKGYKRDVAGMCRNPMKWYNTKKRPLWRHLLDRVAVFILVGSIALGAVAMSVPSVRAAIIRWAREFYETYIVYRYDGEAEQNGQLPQYHISTLPDGFAEVERNSLSGIVDVTYANEDGSVIAMEYASIHQGGLSVFDTSDCDVVNIQVEGMPGQFFDAKIPGNFNTVTWIDEGTATQFSLSGLFSRDELLKMAESIS